MSHGIPDKHAQFGSKANVALLAKRWLAERARGERLEARLKSKNPPTMRTIRRHTERLRVAEDSFFTTAAFANEHNAVILRKTA
jgi:hypothetical protein